MKQEERQLLLKDLSARLPYGVKVQPSGSASPHKFIGYDKGLIRTDTDQKFELENIKPYLRPMYPLTQDEKEEIEVFIFNEWFEEDSCKIDSEGYIEILANYDVSGIEPGFCGDYVDWLNTHHFDYRGLIEKGLALEAPKDMYKQ